MQTSSIAKIAAAVTLILSGVAAHAAAQEIVKLPRVVITGKAVHQQEAVQQLPRVVIVGYSQKTLEQRQLLAAANAAAGAGKTLRARNS